MEKKINDFFQNALVHDMQCIAYAYRPINTVNDGRIPFLNPSDDEDEDPGCAFVVLPYKPPSSDSSDSSNSSSSSSSSESESVASLAASSHTRSKSNDRQPDATKADVASKSRRVSEVSTSSSSESGSSDYSFEDDEPVDEQEEATFYKEVVKGQIFLGMTAMCHQPKQVNIYCYSYFICILTEIRTWLILLRIWV
jgi:hypothetical protein